MKTFIFRQLFAIIYKVSGEKPSGQQVIPNFYYNHQYLVTFVSLLFNHHDEYWLVILMAASGNMTSFHWNRKICQCILVPNYPHCFWWVFHHDMVSMERIETCPQMDFLSPK